MRTFCIWLLLYCINIVAFSQNERFKSLYVYNFTKNIEWPSNYQQGDFVIMVLGNSTIYNELKQNVKGKQIGSQTIQVAQTSNISGIGQCNILYIPLPQSNLIDAAEKQLVGKPTVIVTEKNGMMKYGADINIIQSEGKLQFEINYKQIQQKNLKISKSLFNLGIAFDPGNTRKIPELESVDDASVPR